ncbi:MAG TPA: hypothetical protein VM759_08085 [Longimicrobium sp.]|nr:hypothetical protein [Longimicrobium sp.]
MSDPHPAPPHDPDTGATAEQLELRYRTTFGAPPPRRIRLEIPGWAGASVPIADGAAAQPWHCRPFAEGATHGLELIYPYGCECRVHNQDGRIRFEGELAAEMKAAGLKHPFGAFAAGHYGMDTGLDLLPPPGYALRLGPHPRYFTESSDDVPLALPGHLQRFWPQQFFAVFRAPPPGSVHVFRPGEAYAQLLLVPVGQTYAVMPMEADLAEDREAQERQTRSLSYFLAKRLWKSDAGIWFGDKYKQLLRIFRRGGTDAVRAHLQKTEGRFSRLPKG